MLETLKTTGKTIGRQLNRVRAALSKGSSHALRRRGKLAGEAEKPGELIFLRVDLAGLDQDNYGITIEGNTLQLSGVKVRGWATCAESAGTVVARSGKDNQPATT